MSAFHTSASLLKNKQKNIWIRQQTVNCHAESLGQTVDEGHGTSTCAAVILLNQILNMSLVCTEVITVHIKLIFLHLRINHATLCAVTRTKKTVQRSSLFYSSAGSLILMKDSACLTLMYSTASTFPPFRSFIDMLQLVCAITPTVRHAVAASDSDCLQATSWKQCNNQFLYRSNAGGVSWTTPAAKSPVYFSLLSTPRPRAASEGGLFDRCSVPSRRCIQDTVRSPDHSLLCLSGRPPPLHICMAKAQVAKVLAPCTKVKAR